jgi:hypothetical protein
VKIPLSLLKQESLVQPRLVKIAWWQVGIAGHLTIGDNVRIQAQSGVGRNIKDNEVLQGSPAFGYNDCKSCSFQEPSQTCC